MTRKTDPETAAEGKRRMPYGIRFCFATLVYAVRLIIIICRVKNFIQLNLRMDFRID